ncbi:HrpD5 family protein [Paraburkholderia phosphatilytica]|uniref:HrpD5 family protein n=1 Tax=Paraburkholderia phosphatilytica TaxID=2282883 RepID=UPI000E509208|nr:HrpD5 family protein [Paraburkholderia phosphatilytica]
MTKEIRLLTGRHAGARIKLNPTLTRIGHDDEADIQISDWDLPAMQLSHHEDGRLSIADAAGHGDAVMLDDFVPQRFGNIVLCAGEAGAAWPSDIALLETLLAPAAAPVAAVTETAEVSAIETPMVAAVAARKRHTARNVGLAGVALLAIGCVGIALPAVLQPRPAAEIRGEAPQLTATMLQSALTRLNLADVEVKPQGGRFTIVGIVPDSTSEAMARNVLERIAAGRLDWRIGCVDEIVRSTQESLHDAALTVRYLGKREFAVAGVAKNANAARATLEEISGDLMPMVTRIALQFTSDDRMAAPADIESLLAVDDLQYMVSSDGTKHFVDALHTAQPPSTE